MIRLQYHVTKSNNKSNAKTVNTAGKQGGKKRINYSYPSA